MAFFSLFSMLASAQNSAATLKEYSKEFTTYPFTDPNPIPIATPLYPYFRFDGFTDTSIQKKWKVVELENEYIKLMILPEVGGKIWTAIEKSTNQPFIYYNHAVKFRDIAMRGPWTSGGLEANFGTMGHTPNCATPVDYVVKKNEDGSVSCTIGVLDLLTRTNWRMEINLQKDKAYFTTKCFWYNSTPIDQPYYHWMNGGYKADGNLEFIFPGNKYIGHDGEYSSWPINKTNGKQISFYKNNDFGGYKSYHVFGKYVDFSGGYWHDDDFGTARYGDHSDKAGKKIWIWGLSGQGKIWEKLLTDTDGQYIEMQSGRLFNQAAEKSTFTPFKHIAFAPYASEVFTEYWYPVLKTKGYLQANKYGALNVKKENGWLKVYFSPTQQINAKLLIKNGTQKLYERQLSLKPLQTFADSVKIEFDDSNFIATLGTNLLVYEANPQANVLSRPVETPADFNWNGLYGLYIQGTEYMDEKMYAKAEEKLAAALKVDDNYLPALVKMAELKYRNILYKDALICATKALSIDTYNGSANYIYGLINERLGNVVDAKDGYDLATLTTEYRSAAYTSLARVYLKEANLEKALIDADRAINFNVFNIEALQLKAVIYREQQNKTKAAEVLSSIEALDPLNHFVRFERYLADLTPQSKTGFTQAIRNELPVQTYLELGIWYYNIGNTGTANSVLSLAPVTIETSCWLSFLKNKTVDFKNTKLDYTFPFRAETEAVLVALDKKKSNWILKYHLALIYRDRGQTEKSISYFNACASQPEEASFYAARAETTRNELTRERDLKKALSLEPNGWRYQKLLTTFFIDQEKYELALALVRKSYKTQPKNYIMGMLYAKALMLDRKYEAADKLLTELNLIPFEGATDGRELYREAKLMQAVKLMNQKQYSNALRFVKQARLWLENLGVGQPYDEDIDVRLEDWLEYLIEKKIGNNNESLLQHIVKFSPQIDNTVANFLSVNTLITAKAYEALGESAKAKQWLTEQVKLYPTNKLVLWSEAKYEKNNSVLLKSTEKDANVRVIEELERAKN